MNSFFFQNALDAVLERMENIERMVMEGANPSQQLTSRAPPKQLCIFCDGDHYASACPNYMTLSARSAWAEQRKKCIRYLFDKDHLANVDLSQFATIVKRTAWLSSIATTQRSAITSSQRRWKQNWRKKGNTIFSKKKTCPLLVVLFSLGGCYLLGNRFNL